MAEAIKKYKFVSPGIFLNEIDNSQLPNIPERLGPVVIGRTARGPGMKPVKVDSFSDYVEVFGNPEAGGQGGDIWRDGNHQAPLYATYAAQAWLRNNTPVTMVRLLGCSHEDATSAGAAGWETKDNTGTATGVGNADVNGGAYGLFLINSSSHGILSSSTLGITGKDTTPQTGALAAIWYLNQGSIVLTGTLADNAVTISGSAVLVQSVGADKEFRAIIRDGLSNVVKTTTFNFNKNSQKYIRKVFNTNPTLTNTDIALGDNTASYWLGPTYERMVDHHVSNNSAGQVFGVILGLRGDAATKEGSDFRSSALSARTGWFFGQDLQVVSGAVNSYQPELMTRLFRFQCLDTGEWTQQNIKVSIQDIKASTNPFDPYGVFTVVVRKAEDSDNAPQIIERFSSCNLNPFSSNYVAKKVGDRYMNWDDNERKYTEYGNYSNQSKFIRIEMNGDVDAGAINSELLPFGVYGPVNHGDFALITASADVQSFGASVAGAAYSQAFVKGNTDIVRSRGTATSFVYTGLLSFTGSYMFPHMLLRGSSSIGDLASPKDAYFGLDNSISLTSTRVDPGYKDLVRVLPAGFDSSTVSVPETKYSWIFTLDDLSSSGNHAIYVSGSRAGGTSITANSANNYRGVLDLGFNRYSSPLYGGFDGLDIVEKEPFNNTDLEGGTETTNYAYNSVKRAIDCVADPEVVEYNLATMPGITNEALTSHLMSVCENRGDALAIIDLKGGFVPNTENNLGDSDTSNIGDVDTVISNLKARGINSSYGCAYYPWVQIVDSVTNATLWCPPSVAALGVMGSSETKAELWFAPAGFNRGGLTEGSAGIPVVGVREKLTSKQRDSLYEANINSIASFPSEGIVVFGQKTLQVVPSALDRINVRRLLVFLKKEISRMAKLILFEQNVRETWNGFISKVDPFLRSVKVRFGLADYKIILDETTTTPELIDRNILYAKILLKPARAIEYIAIDFVITDSGASFID